MKLKDVIELIKNGEKKLNRPGLNVGANTIYAGGMLAD